MKQHWLIGWFLDCGGFLYKDPHPNVLDINTPILVYKDIFMRVFMALHF